MVNFEKMSFDDLYESVKHMDSTDPACMDKVLAYYEEVNEETENFMKMLGEKLKFETISWKRPWYQTSTRITRPFIESATGNEDDTYYTGPMTQDEVDILESNWHIFIKTYDVPDRIICLARWKTQTSNRYKLTPEEHARVYVVAFLAQGLKRTMNQVFLYIAAHFGEPKKTTYSKEEEKIMEICFYHEPKRAVIYLSCILARDRRGIYKRLHKVSNGKSPNYRLDWTLELATKFVNLLMEYTGESLEGLKNKKIDMGVWMKLEKEFKKERQYLQHFWNTTLHCQLFVKHDVTLRRLRRKVLRILRDSPYKIWSDIRWKEVAKHFPDGLTFQFLHYVTLRLFRCYPRYYRVPLQELVAHGLYKCRRKGFGNRRLKTLVLNAEGNLQIQMYDEKLTYIMDK